jgi:hypothetical protein
MKSTVPFTRFDGSVYHETYELTEWFCPACGKQTVWQECSEGDYYAGPQIVCSSCGGSMQWPLSGSSDGSPEPRVSILAEALKIESEAGR